MVCPNLGEKKLRKRLDATSRMNVVKINDVEYNVLDAAYAESIYPVQPQGTWVILKNVQNVNLLPPISRVMPNHHKTQRIPSKGEHSQERKCSRCSVKGHYRSTCKEAIPVTNKKQII
ncbi:unnamed protein product [Prunus armeniaca]